MQVLDSRTKATEWLTAVDVESNGTGGMAALTRSL